MNIFFWPYHGPSIDLPVEISLHLLCAAVVILPLLRRTPALWWLGCLVAGGILIDLDHAVAAHTLNPAEMTGLEHRPFTHSLLLVSLMGLSLGALTRSVLYGYLFWAALMAHLLYDAPGAGIMWLWPITGMWEIPSLWAALGLLALTGLSAWVGRHTAPARREGLPRWRRPLI